MSVFKCKMCGGALEIAASETVATCEYCGTQQTLPTCNDDILANLHNRANTLRLKCEFDKAEEIYNKILEKDNNDAEAHWGVILCKYGIEYVEDPKTLKRVPTCHRTSFDAVSADEDYKAALANADTLQREIYEAEAREIERIQKDILTIVNNEKPFDVFICYKETDENGKRTQDSVIANDIYHQLTTEGLKVFYAAITLEDKIGREYEPYIFAALNSARVMLVVGSRPEYFNAVWVKNEWSRFLKLIKTDRSKLLIPCYKNMDAYELPEEFAHLQAQDMGKIGFINDVVRGIRKVVTAASPTQSVVKETVVVNNTATNSSTAPLLKRAFMFLEDADFNGADEYAEKVLDIDPECAEAYLAKLMAETGTRRREELKNLPQSFEGSINCQKLMRFGDDALQKEIKAYIDFILDRNETARKEGIYKNALALKNKNTPNDYDEAIKLFLFIIGYKDAEKQIEDCKELKKEYYYNEALSLKSKNTPNDYDEAIKLFSSIKGYKDSEKQIKDCRELIKEYYYLDGKNCMAKGTKYSLSQAIKAFSNIKGYKDADTLIKECENKIQQLDEKAKIAAVKAAKKRKKILAIISSITAVLIVFVILLNTVIIPYSKYGADYKNAVILMEEKKYSEAIAAFEAMDGYKDSADKIEACNTAIKDEKYNEAVKLMEEKKYPEAIAAFEAIKGYKDSAAKIEECKPLTITNPAVGKSVYFGSYEQDNDTSNGKEAIEWLVLGKEENKILVISKYALDCKQYNTSKDFVTWETCSLRKWLNNEFINSAFSEEEKAKIPTVTVSADKNPEYSTDPGRATIDKVFLLSITEAEKYFTTDEARKCVPTAYAKAQGAYTSDSYTSGGKDTCWWWLRSPGYDQAYAACVRHGGSVLYFGLRVSSGSDAVRPALWIELK